MCDCGDDLRGRETSDSVRENEINSSKMISTKAGLNIKAMSQVEHQQVDVRSNGISKHLREKAKKKPEERSMVDWN